MLSSKLLTTTTTTTSSVAGQLGQALVRLLHGGGAGGAAAAPASGEATSKPSTTMTPNRAFRSYNQSPALSNAPRVLITGSFGQLGIGLAQLMR